VKKFKFIDEFTFFPQKRERYRATAWKKVENSIIFGQVTFWKRAE
jgi:hypothetical protein